MTASLSLTLRPTLKNRNLAKLIRTNQIRQNIREWKLFQLQITSLYSDQDWLYLPGGFSRCGICILSKEKKRRIYPPSSHTLWNQGLSSGLRKLCPGCNPRASLLSRCSSEYLCAATRRITSPKASPDLWSSRPNLMGHQSSNPHQPAQWISQTPIWSRPGPSQRALTPTKCKSEVAPLGQRPARVYPCPQAMWPGWPGPVPPGKRNRKTGRPKKTARPHTHTLRPPSWCTGH